VQVVHSRRGSNFQHSGNQVEPNGAVKHNQRLFLRLL
jgi:hypothetical protein